MRQNGLSSGIMGSIVCVYSSHCLTLLPLSHSSLCLTLLPLSQTPLSASHSSLCLTLLPLPQSRPPVRLPAPPFLPLEYAISHDIPKHLNTSYNKVSERERGVSIKVLDYTKKVLDYVKRYRQSKATHICSSTSSHQLYLCLNLPLPLSLSLSIFAGRDREQYDGLSGHYLASYQSAAPSLSGPVITESQQVVRTV